MADSPVSPTPQGVTNTQIGGQNTVNINLQLPAFYFRAIPWPMIPPGVPLNVNINIINSSTSPQTTMVPAEDVDGGSSGGDSDLQDGSRKRKKRSYRGRDENVDVRKSRRLEARAKR